MLICLLLFAFSFIGFNGRQICLTISRPAPRVSALWPKDIFLLFICSLLYLLTAALLCFALQMVQVIIPDSPHVRYSSAFSKSCVSLALWCHDCYQQMHPQLLHIPLLFPLLDFFFTPLLYHENRDTQR